MNIPHLTAVMRATSLICLMMGSAAAQPTDAARDARPRPGVDTKPTDAGQDVRPRPGVDAKPSDVAQDVRPRPGVDAKPADAAQDVRPRPGPGKPTDAAKDVQPPPRETGRTKGRDDPKRTTLTVRKILIPSGDPGKFNLSIDGVFKVFAVGNTGTTGPISVTAGTHSVSEMAGISTTNLANYITVIKGDCNSSGSVTLAAGQNKTCTITNTRKKVKPPFTGEVMKLDGAITHLVATEVVPPGSWTQGPGTYSFTVCAVGTTGAPCNIYGAPGQSVAIKFEAWGAGGGGGGGFQDFSTVTFWSTNGGPGGGGGGGGGYDTRTMTVTVGTTFSVVVGAAGPGGTPGAPCAQAAGGDGGVSHIELSNGTYVVKATGGMHGWYGSNCVNNSGGLGGAGGIGTFNSWAGQSGYQGGIALGCAGAAGGLGGVGGGPGGINNGGGGGHGGWMRHLMTCAAHALNYGLTPGAAGGNGKVTLSW